MKKIVIIGTVWPEPASTAAGQRMMQLIDIFKKIGYEIIFTSTASSSEFAINLENLNIKYVSIELNNDSFDNFIKNLNPSIVLFDRFITEEQFGWRVTNNCPNAIKILDTEDLHFLREARQNCYKQNKICTITNLQTETAKREIAAIYRCDLSLIISKYELDLLINTFKIAPDLLHYIPMIYNQINENQTLNYPRFEERQHFFSIGNFYHQPNWDAVLLLKKSYWNPIRKLLPTTELHIYGAYMPNKSMQLHNPNEGFIIKGRIKNSEDAFKNHRVLLAPLPYGAGIKGKLLQSMLFGCPSVTTSIGSEAMHENLDWNGFIEDNPTMFAQKAAELYINKKQWIEAQKNGINIINQCFNKATFTDKFTDKITYLIYNREKHRSENFIGQILNHHTLKSTMYMSKWIQEKNAHKLEKQ